MFKKLAPHKIQTLFLTELIKVHLVQFQVSSYSLFFLTTLGLLKSVFTLLIAPLDLSLTVSFLFVFTSSS